MLKRLFCLSVAAFFAVVAVDVLCSQEFEAAQAVEVVQEIEAAEGLIIQETVAAQELGAEFELPPRIFDVRYAVPASHAVPVSTVAPVAACTCAPAPRPCCAVPQHGAGFQPGFQHGPGFAASWAVPYAHPPTVPLYRYHYPPYYHYHPPVVVYRPSILCRIFRPAVVTPYPYWGYPHGYYW